MQTTSPSSQAKDSNVFSRGGQSQKTKTKELNRDYGNKNKVYMFRLAILRSQFFEWQFCEAHCLQWQIANFLGEKRDPQGHESKDLLGHIIKPLSKRDP